MTQVLIFIRNLIALIRLAVGKSSYIMKNAKDKILKCRHTYTENKTYENEPKAFAIKTMI